MDTPRQVAQFREGGPQLRGGAIQRLCKDSIRIRIEPMACHPQCERQGDKAMLRPVVQITLQAASRSIVSCHNPCSGGAHILKLRAYERMQPFILDGNRHGGGSGRH